MASKKSGSENGDPPEKFITEKATGLIEGSLRTFYDGIVEEGTPDKLLDLLEKLDAAEKAAVEKSK